MLPPRLLHFPCLQPVSCRYKAAGANAVDETGLKDTVEFINISKDDALAFPTPVHRTYPASVVERMEGTVRPFVEKSLAVNNTVLEVFNEKLGLPKGALLDLHRREEKSCSEARCIKNPPAKEMSPERQALGAHTDFGSLVRLGQTFRVGRADRDVVFLAQQARWTASVPARCRWLVLHQGTPAPPPLHS